MALKNKLRDKNFVIEFIERKKKKKAKTHFKFQLFIKIAFLITFIIIKFLIN